MLYSEPNLVFNGKWHVLHRCAVYQYIKITVICWERFNYSSVCSWDMHFHKAPNTANKISSSSYFPYHLSVHSCPRDDWTGKSCLAILWQQIPFKMTDKSLRSDSCPPTCAGILVHILFSGCRSSQWNDLTSHFYYANWYITFVNIYTCVFIPSTVN